MARILAYTRSWLGELTRPVVLVTTSSEFQNDHRLVEAAFEGLADEPFEHRRHGSRG